MTDHLVVLREREKYLRGRIRTKSEIGWETQWDERERAALEWAIVQLTPAALRSCTLCPTETYVPCPYVGCPLK